MEDSGLAAAGTAGRDTATAEKPLPGLVKFYAISSQSKMSSIANCEAVVRSKSSRSKFSPSGPPRSSSISPLPALPS